MKMNAPLQSKGEESGMILQDLSTTTEQQKTQVSEPVQPMRAAHNARSEMAAEVKGHPATGMMPWLQMKIRTVLMDMLRRSTILSSAYLQATLQSVLCHRQLLWQLQTQQHHQSLRLIQEHTFHTAHASGQHATLLLATYLEVLEGLYCTVVLHPAA